MLRLAKLMRFFFGVLLIVVVTLNTSSSQTLPRMAFTPDSVNLMPGQTASVSVALSEEIICPGSAVTCDVKVNLEPLREDPRISISVAELVWVPTQWNQTRAFQISMTGSAPPLFVKTFGLYVESNSELYKAFSAKFTVVAGRAAVPSLSAWAVFMLAIMLTLIVRYRFSRGN